MKTADFLRKLKNDPASISFDDTIATVAESYEFTPTAFSNGDARNGPGESARSCQLFAFAKLNQLSKDEALACFGKYYTDDVLGHPDGTDHQQIRNFMKYGWDGVSFDGTPLKPRTALAD